MGRSANATEQKGTMVLWRANVEECYSAGY